MTSEKIQQPQVVIQTSYPPIIGIEELAQLLGKSPATIMADRVRAPERVPPSYTPPGGKAPRWLVSDVIAWLRSGAIAGACDASSPAPDDETTPATATATATAPRRRGRPTKAEQIARRHEGGEK